MVRVGSGGQKGGKKKKQKKEKPRAVDVVSWRDAEPPIVLCRSMGRTEGAFEGYVRELAEARGMVQGVDYWHFN